MNETKALHDGVYDFWCRQGLATGVGVLVALSGGGDSVALLHLLRRVAPRLSLNLRAAHLDHAIRVESGADVDFVRRLCSDLQVPLTIERLDVPLLARQRGQGLEEAGRELRRDFLQRTARQLGCTYIALGHHRGDQAETLLLRLLRGSGLTGLSAMRPCRGPFVRPLLTFSRKQIDAYLADSGHGFVQDASNDDLYYTRNRIRHQLLPEMTCFNPRLEEHLAALSHRIAAEEDYWQQEAEKAFAAVRSVQGGELCLDRPALLALHPALRARVLRRALQEVRGDLRAIGAIHVEALEDLLTGAAPQADAHLPAAWAGRRYERLWLRCAPPVPPAPFAIEVSGPGDVYLPDGRCMQISLEAQPLGESKLAVEFPAAAVPFPLTVRTFRPGDRFQPQGAPGSRKLKKYFIDARVEREVRAGLPLLAGTQILWLAGMERCHGWRCETGCGPVLRAVLKTP